LPVAGFTDGRHLGCGGSRSSSRKYGRCGPWPRNTPCTAGPRASVTRAARRVRGPRAPTLRGGGARVVRSSKAQFPDRSGAWYRRSLLPTMPRSHDERCPSGSGWGRGLSQSPARVTACGYLWKDAGARMAECGKPHAHHCARETAGSKACQPLARETSAGDRQRNRIGPDSRRRPVGWSDGAQTSSDEGSCNPQGSRPREGQRGWEPARRSHPSSRWRLLLSCEAEAETLRSSAPGQPAASR